MKKKYALTPRQNLEVLLETISGHFTDLSDAACQDQKLIRRFKKLNKRVAKLAVRETRSPLGGERC